MRTHFIYCVIVIFSIIACNSTNDKNFILNGEINGLSDSTEVELTYMALNDGIWNKISERCYSVNSKFMFKGKVDGLTAAFLYFDNNSIDLYLEPTTIELDADINMLWNYKLSGMKSDKCVSLLNDKLECINKNLHTKTADIFTLLDNLNSITENSNYRDSLMSVLRDNNGERYDLIREIDKIKYDFTVENNNSTIAPVLIYSLARTNLIDIDKIIYLYERLPNKSRNSVAGNLANEQVKQAKKQSNSRDIAVNSLPLDFSGTDIKGDQIRLSEEIGEGYVLLDFWASWCAPCLGQLPYLKDINSRFSDSALKIISISVDSDKQQWINAIDNHKLNGWSQILSTTDSKDNYFANDISNDYGVETIPKYFLINKEGKIAAIWSQIGEEQIAVITELLQ